MLIKNDNVFEFIRKNSYTEISNDEYHHARSPFDLIKDQLILKSDCGAVPEDDTITFQIEEVFRGLNIPVLITMTYGVSVNDDVSVIASVLTKSISVIDSE